MHEINSTHVNTGRLISCNGSPEARAKWAPGRCQVACWRQRGCEPGKDSVWDTLLYTGAIPRTETITCTRPTVNAKIRDGQDRHLPVDGCGGMVSHGWLRAWLPLKDLYVNGSKGRILTRTRHSVLPICRRRHSRLRVDQPFNEGLSAAHEPPAQGGPLDRSGGDPELSRARALVPRALRWLAAAAPGAAARGSDVIFCRRCGSEACLRR